jgi:hypothetical protein
MDLVPAIPYNLNQSINATQAEKDALAIYERKEK